MGVFIGARLNLDRNLFSGEEPQKMKGEPLSQNAPCSPPQCASKAKGGLGTRNWSNKKWLLIDASLGVRALPRCPRGNRLRNSSPEGACSFNPFRAAVPFGGQTAQILCGLSSKRDCGTKRNGIQYHVCPSMMRSILFSIDIQNYTRHHYI